MNKIKDVYILRKVRFISDLMLNCVFWSGGSVELTLHCHITSGQSVIIFEKSISRELHNMGQYPDIVKHSGIQNTSWGLKMKSGWN